MLANNKKWYRASLRLLGDGLPVEEIEARLDLEPDSVGRKGAHPRGNPRYGKCLTNIWGRPSNTKSDVPFEQQIAKLLDELEPKRDELQKILALPDVKGELFLGFSSGNGQGGGELSLALLKRITEFGLSISLDLYPRDIDEKEEG
jgi:hypothetical protein